MAITNANFNAGDYLKSSGKRIITCSSDKIGVANVFKYRFYLELTYDSKTFAYTFRPNNEDYGMFNISKILQTIVHSISVQQVKTVPQAIETTGITNDFQQNIHTIPHQKYDSGYVPQMFSTGGESVKKVVATLYDFYSDTEEGTPTKRATGSATDNLYVISGYDLQSDLINVDYSDFKLTGNTKKLISHNYNFDGTEYIINVELGDFGTLALLNRTKEINTTAEPVKIIITYKNASDVTLATEVLEQNSTYGGNYDATGVDDDSMLIYAGLYPANLDKLPSSYDRPSDYSTLSYYRVQVGNTSNLARSDVYRFNIITRCDKFDSQRFAYINKFGVWEYITFNKRRTDRLTNKKTEIKKSAFDYASAYATTSSGYNEKPYTPNVAHQSKKVVSTDIDQAFTINTGYLKEYDIEQVRDMFLSPMIHYLNADGSARAVILTNQSIEDVVVSHKHEQTEYALTFKYSVNTYNPVIT